MRFISGSYYETYEAEYEFSNEFKFHHSALGPCLRPEFGYNCQSPLTLLSVLSPCLSSAKLTARDLSKPPGYIKVGSPNWPLTVLSND